MTAALATCPPHPALWYNQKMSQEKGPVRPNLYFALGAAATIALLVSSQLVTPYKTLFLKVAGITAVPLSLLFMSTPFYYLKKYGRVEAEKDFVYTT